MSAALKLELFREGEFIREVPVEDGEMWLGRDEDCVIRLDDRAISRKHALFRSKNQNLEVEKKSKFGQLKVNGKPVDHVALSGGERIEFGPFELRVKIEKEEVIATVTAAPEPVVLAPPAPPIEVAPPPPPQPEMAFAPVSEEIVGVEAIPSSDLDLGGMEMPVDGQAASDMNGNSVDAQAASDSSFDFAEVDQDGKTRVLPVQKETIKAILQFGDGAANVTYFEINETEIAIGRSQKCHVVLEDKKASRKHSIIKKDGDKFTVKDLGSANGTLVNGERVDERELQSGDVLQIGDTQFTFKMVQSDYEQKKAEFIAVPESEIPQAAPAPAPLPMAAPIQEMPVFQSEPQVAFQGAPAGASAQPFAAPAAENKSIIGKFLDRYRAMNTKQQIIYGALILVGIYYLLDEEQEPQRARLNTGQVQSAAAKKAAAAKKQDRRPGALPTFETLTPEQQRYIRTQYDLSFDLYKNREYDSALLEVGKIFSLVQDYKNAREIEAFAREGKRKLEAQEEERKKKEQERQAQIKLQGLLDQAGLYMEKGQHKEAEAIFPDIEILQPENLAVSNWRKLISEEKAKIEQEHVEKKRIEKLNADAKAELDRAITLYKESKFFEGLDVLDALLTRTIPDQKITEQAKDEIRRCEEAIASARDPHLEQGRLLEQEGKYTEAYAEFQKALAADPTDTDAPKGMKRIQETLNSKAKSIYAEGVFAESFSDFENAEKKYREVLEAVPNDNSYYLKAASRLKKLTVLRRPAGEPVQ